jgi:hypothetical protein
MAMAAVIAIAIELEFARLLGKAKQNKQLMCRREDYGSP